MDLVVVMRFAVPSETIELGPEALVPVLDVVDLQRRVEPHPGTSQQ
jgi:hypothetical protein